LNIYCPSQPKLLIDLCPSFDGFSLADFLTKLNTNLVRILKNKELVIGHALFLDDRLRKDGAAQASRGGAATTSASYVWNFGELEVLFNFKILPIIEEYCYGNQDQIFQIIGNELPKRLSGDAFKTAIVEFASA
jgi:5-methylcytosine-specific restriction protein B